MERIKKTIASINKEINVNSLTAEQCHILYFFYTKSELSKIDSTSFFKASNLILSFLDEEDLKKIIQNNQRTQELDNTTANSQAQNTPDENPSKKNDEKKVATFNLSQKELIEKLKQASLIQKKWIVEHLILIKNKAFSLDYLKKQKNNLMGLIEQRKKNIIFFNEYLRKGKKTIELLNAKYFINFKKEVNELLTFLTSKNIANQEEFFENYYDQKGSEENKTEELTFLRMLYDSTKENKLKKIIYLAYSNFPDRDLEQIKNHVLKKILSR